MKKTVHHHLSRISLLTLILMLSTFAALFAQRYEEDEASFDKEHYSFTKIIEIQGAAQSDLFERARFWAANNFRTRQDKIEVQDKASGRIILTGSISVPSPGRINFQQHRTDYVLFTAIIDVRPGKCRIHMDHFIHQGGFYDSTPNPTGGELKHLKADGNWFSKGRWNRIKTYVHKTVTGYNQSLQEAVEGKSDYFEPGSF